jgi:Na+-driven multidrug efflux pump
MSSMFQAMGTTRPSLVTSAVRLVVVAIAAVLLSQVPGFRLTWVWYLTVVSVLLQTGLSLWLLRREFALRLPDASLTPEPATASPA